MSTHCESFMEIHNVFSIQEKYKISKKSDDYQRLRNENIFLGFQSSEELLAHKQPLCHHKQHKKLSAIS